LIAQNLENFAVNWGLNWHSPRSITRKATWQSKGFGLIFNAVSKALFDLPKGKWAQELITSVWGHNNSRTRTTGFTPFCLLYDKEAITAEELKLASFHAEIATTTPIQRYVELEAVENARLHAASNLD
jgi:hypothetical protein